MTDAVFNAGFEDFFGIIIFLVVIGRIISSIKNTASAPKPKPNAPPQNVNPDLERFFKALTGQPLQEKITEEQQDPPPPPPVPVVKSRPAPVVVSATTTVPRRAQPLRSVSKIKTIKTIQRPAQKWGNVSFNLGGADSPAGKSAATRAARAEVMQMLRDNNSIKKAVLLREILGPPVSLRT